MSFSERRAAPTLWTRIAWYGALTAGLAPILVLGFLASALANRLIFAGWALGCAVVYAGTLRYGWGAGWRRDRLAAVALFVVAVAGAAFGVLTGRHQEIFDLGFRAVLPAFYPSGWTRPATYYLLAALLALGSLLTTLGGAVAAGRRAPAAE